MKLVFLLLIISACIQPEKPPVIDFDDNCMGDVECEFNRHTNPAYMRKNK